MPWTVLGTLLSLVGIVVFAAVYAAPSGEAELRIGGALALRALFVAAALTLILFVTHEVVHGLAMRLFGAQPEYGVTTVDGVLRALHCTAPGHQFTRGQYAAVALAPVLLVSAVEGLLVAFAPFGGWLVFPLGLHLGGAIGDLWVTVLVARQPQGTLVEPHASRRAVATPATPATPSSP